MSSFTNKYDPHPLINESVLNYSRTVVLLGRHSGGEMIENGPAVILRCPNNKMHPSLATCRAVIRMGQENTAEKGTHDEISNSKGEN